MQGYWNGADATFIGVTYVVTETGNPLWWQNTHIDETRQGLMITQGRDVWLIDNQYGDGYFKVTEGLGWFRYSHKSLENPAHVTFIPDGQVIKILDQSSLDNENYAHDQWIKCLDPEEYERMQSVKRQLQELYSSPEYTHRSY